MVIVLGMTCGAPLPEVWLSQRNGIKIFPEGAGYRVSLSIDSPECDRFIDFLRQERRYPNVFYFVWKQTDDPWTAPEDCWVGAIPLADDYVDPSPANTFDPALPPPCYGLVPSQLPLTVLQRPRENAVDVRLETIFSAPLATFLASVAPCEFGDVILHNKEMKNYRRLFPTQSRKVIVGGVLRKGLCRACGTSEMYSPGVWLGRRVDDLLVCRDEQGVGHLSAEHHVIFSIAVAQQMERRFGTGYGLDPIIDIESPEGQRVLYLFQRMEELEGFRERERE
jgi:hypothetical protein